MLSFLQKKPSDALLERLAFEGSPTILFAIDGKFTILFASEFAAKEIGWTGKELLGRSLLSFSHSGDIEAAQSLAESCLRRPGEVVHTELRKVCRDFRDLWVNERMRAVTEDGALVILVAWEDITERLQLAVASREIETKYCAIVDAMDGGIYVCSSDYRIQFMNRNMVERIGRHTCGELCYKAFHGLDEPCSWCMNDRVFRGETVRWEVQSPKDGRWYYVIDTPIYHSDGTLSKQTIIQDVTDRKNDEQAQLRAFTDSALDAIVMMDPDGKITFWNPAAETILGYRKEEAMGKDLHQLLTPQRYHEAYRKSMPEFVRTGHGNAMGKTVELMAIRKDGVEIDVALSLSAISLDGKWHTIGILRDITRRKLAEKILQSSEERFRQLAENIRDVFRIIPIATDEPLYVSPAYEQIWERSLESIYKNPELWLQSVHPDDRERAHHFAAIQRKNEYVEVEYRIHTPDGQEKWIRDRAFPIHDRAGKLIRVAGIAEEITAQKLYEQELILAKRAAEAASRAKNAFLATMSHELRTPLNAILGFTELLELEMGDRHLHDWVSDVQKIRRAGNHLLDLISDILDLALIEADRMKLQQTSFKMVDVVEEVVSSVEPLASKNRVKVRSVCDPGAVWADQTRLRQCLFNLLGNACKFTQDGEVVVEAKTNSEAGGGWTVRVIDNGIGVRGEDLKLIFEDFAQSDVSVSRNFGGSGLGLPISRKLSRMMGGDITVESTLGKGSVFTLRLPSVPGSMEMQGDGTSKRIR